jgi:hypothetical protein
MALLFDFAAVAAALALTGFFVLPQTRQLYESSYAQMPVLISFVKFALLATAGEMLANRIRTGIYAKKGFGAFPKMLIWGFIGIVIYWIFAIFSNGVPAAFPRAAELLIFDLPIPRAFLISLFMNLFFAPVMMLGHNLSDRFIAANGGSFPLRRWNTRELLQDTDWKRMWNFVFARTIPFFWVPAHTVTFLLPAAYRTLFAALLSVALGLILAFAASAPQDRKEGEA